jgi:hypothetical protein
MDISWIFGGGELKLLKTCTAGHPNPEESRCSQDSTFSEVIPLQSGNFGNQDTP